MHKFLAFTLRTLLLVLLAFGFGTTLLIAITQFRSLGIIEWSLQRHVEQFLLERPTMELVMTTLSELYFALWVAITLNLLLAVLLSVKILKRPSVHRGEA